MDIDFNLFEERSLFYMRNKNKVHFGIYQNLFNLSIEDVIQIKTAIKDHLLCTDSNFISQTSVTISLDEFDVKIVEVVLDQRSKNKAKVSWNVDRIIFFYNISNNIYYREYMSTYSNVDFGLYYNNQLVFDVKSYNNSACYIYNNMQGYSIKIDGNTTTIRLKYRTTVLEYAYENNILQQFTYTISGLKNGPCITYKNGIIKKVITYDMGVQQGYYYFFNKKGELVNKYNYNRGKRQGDSWKDLDKKNPKLTYYFDGVLCENKEDFETKNSACKTDNVFKPSWLPKQVEVKLEDIDLSNFMKIKDMKHLEYTIPTIEKLRAGYYPWM